jgi:hypothetical protein
LLETIKLASKSQIPLEGNARGNKKLNFGSLFPPPIHRPLSAPQIPLEPRIRRVINPPAAVPIRDREAAIVARLHGVCSVAIIAARAGIGAP